LAVSKETSVLFIPEGNARSLLWSGPLLNADEASGLSGIGDVRSMETLDDYLREVLPGVLDLKCDLPGSGDLEQGLRLNAVHLRSTLEKLTEHLNWSSLHTCLRPLRMRKEAEELEAIRRACDITRQGFLRVLECLRPGLYEYQLEAELSCAFLSAGASGHAYEPIVASGENALVLHYVSNSASCKEGQLVLMDFGAEWNNYASDCSRTLPVSGRYTTRQKELYRAVHRVFLYARDLMRPGARLVDVHQQVGQRWEEEHIKLGLYTLADVKARGEKAPLWTRYFMHGTSHSMGLDVHDPFDRQQAFEEGMVLTCEPAIYLPDEGLGLRLENDILISERGPVDLMESIPMDLEEIEELMNSTKA